MARMTGAPGARKTTGTHHVDASRQRDGSGGVSGGVVIKFQETFHFKSLAEIRRGRNYIWFVDQ